MSKILISTLAAIGLMAATLVAYAAPYDADPMVIEFSVEQSLHDANQMTFAVLTVDPIDLPAPEATASTTMLGPGLILANTPLEIHDSGLTRNMIPPGERLCSSVMDACSDTATPQPG